MSDAPPDEHHATLEIRNRLGLHARAAVLLVQPANQFEAEVTVSKDGQSVNGRSILGIMMLAAEQGSSIDVTTVGPQAEQASRRSGDWSMPASTRPSDPGPRSARSAGEHARAGAGLPGPTTFG